MICVNSVSVSPKSISLKVGSWSYVACAQVCPSDADCKEIRWHSDNPSVASVNASSGYICANAVGTAKIYATATDGSGCSDYLTVTVSNTISVTSVTLNRSAQSLEKGQRTSLSATVCPDNATNKNVNWTSSNTGVATVSNGIVTAVSKGSARITATAADGSGKSASCVVTVTGDILVTSIALTPSNTTLRVGYSVYPSVTVCPVDATDKCVTWSSANSNIASVNPNSGLVYAKAVGVTTIYATACDGSGVCGCCTVRVVPVYVRDITVCPEALTLDIGKSAHLEAIVSPVNATNQSISWVSGDCNIADVDANGRVTGKTAGTTYIYAYATDGSGVYGCCEVTSNTPGTDSVGVFQNLSMLSATPAGTETEAPVLLGVQFTKPQNGCYSMRFVSQIKTLHYSRVGHEIHSKFGNNKPVPHILFSKVAYTSLLADGKKVYPNAGYNYFVVGVIENIPENTIASFHIVPFAITLEGQYLYADKALYSCKDAKEINYAAFEESEHSSISSHVYHATPSGNKYTFSCAFSKCNDKFTVSKEQVVGSYVTSSTDSRLGNSQTPLAYGIDVSKWQGNISQEQWKEIANTQIDGHTITFAILRIGTEVKAVVEDVINRQKDKYFESNYARAKAAGLQVGCYYLTESRSPKNAIGDAEQVIEWIGDKQFEYPIFFDIESKLILENVPDSDARTEICTAFMNKMREKGFFVGLYTNNAWIKNNLNSNTLLPKYDFWYARYQPGNPTPNFWGGNDENNWAGAGRKFGMWQYTEERHIPPISGNVCCDVAYKNYPLIIKALHLNNFK